MFMLHLLIGTQQFCSCAQNAPIEQHAFTWNLFAIHTGTAKQTHKQCPPLLLMLKILQKGARCVWVITVKLVLYRARYPYIRYHQVVLWISIGYPEYSWSMLRIRLKENVEHIWQQQWHPELFAHFLRKLPFALNLTLAGFSSPAFLWPQLISCICVLFWSLAVLVLWAEHRASFEQYRVCFLGFETAVYSWRICVDQGTNEYRLNRTHCFENTKKWKEETEFWILEKTLKRNEKELQAQWRTFLSLFVVKINKCQGEGAVSCDSLVICRL